MRSIVRERIWRCGFFRWQTRAGWLFWKHLRTLLGRGKASARTKLKSPALLGTSKASERVCFRWNSRTLQCGRYGPLHRFDIQNWIYRCYGYVYMGTSASAGSPAPQLNPERISEIRWAWIEILEGLRRTMKSLNESQANVRQLSLWISSTNFQSLWRNMKALCSASCRRDPHWYLQAQHLQIKLYYRR